MRAMMASQERTLGARPERAKSLRSNPAKGLKAARVEMRRDARPITEGNSAALRRSDIRQALNSQGQPLGESIRPAMESQLGFDFSRVRIHNDASAAESASALNAAAYTSGSHIFFGVGRLDPSASAGRALLAHELAHVAQQGARSRWDGRIGELAPAVESAHEVEADRAADSITRRSSFHSITSIEPGTLQRKMAMRDVGKGEQSGFARVPELITRLNGASTGLVFALTGSDLTYTVKPGGTLSNFDTQMEGFIDQAAVIPLRFTNRHGLLGNKTAGFHEGVTEDAWSSGYVDIDDLLASSDLGMQTVLVHFLRERSATNKYAERIGTESLNTDPASPQGAAHQAEFDAAHAKGIQAELQVLQDFFSDPTIRLINPEGSGQVFRVFRNGRKDIIRTRVRPGHGAEAGVDPVTIEVVTRDGKVHTPEEYKALIAAATAAPPVPVGTGAAAAPP